MTRSQTPPKQMAKKLVRLLRVERPDYEYLKKVFQHTRLMLAVYPAKMKSGSRNCSPIMSWSLSTKLFGTPATRRTWS